MNIETTMKINTLMRELKKHGIAVSSEDAYKKAEQLVSLGTKKKVEEKSEYDVMFESKTEAKKEEVKTEEPQVNTQFQNAPAPPQNSALLQKQVELMIQMNMKNVHSKIVNMENTILSLQTELSALRTELSSVKAMKIEGLEGMDKKTKQAAAAPAQKVLPAETKEEKKEHPKQGNFGPGSIDIKKYFYYGNK